MSWAPSLPALQMLLGADPRRQVQGPPPLTGSPTRRPVSRPHPQALSGTLLGEGAEPVGWTPPPPEQAPSCPWPVSLTSLPACQDSAILKWEGGSGRPPGMQGLCAEGELHYGHVGDIGFRPLDLWFGASAALLDYGVPPALSTQRW